MGLKSKQISDNLYISLKEHEYKNRPENKSFEENWELEWTENMIKDFKRQINTKSKEYVGEEKIGSIDKETVRVFFYFEELLRCIISPVVEEIIYSLSVNTEFIPKFIKRNETPFLSL